MGQAEVVKVLQKNNTITAEEIARQINESIVAVQVSLNSMFKSGEVERIKLTRDEVEEKGIRFSGRHYEWKLTNGK